MSLLDRKTSTKTPLGHRKGTTLPIRKRSNEPTNGKVGIAGGPVLDPYGTLTHCFLFVARNATNTLYRYSIGVYQDGTIRLLSDPIPGEYFSGEFYGSLDLYKDGTVEIVAGLTYRRMDQFEALAIFSWDGSSGIRTGDRDTSGEPRIDALVGSFEIADMDGDGIDEIRGEIGDIADGFVGYDVERTATFGWSGNKYGERKQ